MSIQYKLSKAAIFATCILSAAEAKVWSSETNSDRACCNPGDTSLTTMEYWHHHFHSRSMSN